jgi:predicted nucleic acid-binding protein
MILADTSVWVGHFRAANPQLQELLAKGRILTHPFVVGEIACGQLRQRAVILDALKRLPQALVASHEEVLRLIEERRLSGTGLGWVDVHLLASALLTGCRLWTLDRRLRHAAEELVRLVGQEK